MKIDKLDSAPKTPRFAVGKDKLAGANSYELKSMALDNVDHHTAVENGILDGNESYHTGIDHHSIEIVIDPPPEEPEITKM